MGWIKDCFELTVALGTWGRRRVQANGWKERLRVAHSELLRERPDLSAAEETLQLAHEAGFKGPELAVLERRIEAIRDYEESGYPRKKYAKAGDHRKAKKKSSKKSSKRSSTAKSVKKPVTKKATAKKGAAGKATTKKYAGSARSRSSQSSGRKKR